MSERERSGIATRIGKNRIHASAKLGTAQILTILVLVLVLAPLVVQPGNIAYADTSVSPFLSSCSHAIQQTYDSMNQTNAIANALSSSFYATGVSSYVAPTFNSIFQIDKGTSPYPTCTEKVENYNVVFTLHNSTGGWAGYLVITESQNLAVIGSSYQLQRVVSTQYYGNWAGFEFEGNTGATQAIYLSESYYTQPTISYPTYGCSYAGGNECNISVWTGLEDTLGATDGKLAQAGSDAFCPVSNSACSTTVYYGFYQTGASSSSVLCTTGSGGLNISGGDSIFAYTENGVAYGGSSSEYSFGITDNSNSESCIASNVSYSSLPSPTWAPFIVENALTSCACEPLGGFGSSNTVSFSSAEIDTGGSTNYVNNYAWASSIMQNRAYSGGSCSGSEVTNVSYGSVNSGGDLTMTYSSNQYTPYYYEFC